MQPTLTTSRLRLRPYELGDAGAVQRLAGEPRVARAASAIPHPYPDGKAERWIGIHAAGFATRREITFAVTLLNDGRLVGAMGLIDLSKRHGGRVGTAPTRLETARTLEIGFERR